MIFSIKNLRNIHFKAASFALILSGISLGSPKPTQSEEVSCSSQWAENAIGYLENKVGFRPPFTFCFELSQGETYDYYIWFDERDVRMGDDHLLVAECDSDCNDIDLTVFDDLGREVGRDTSSSSYAEVRLDNIYDGKTFQVKIDMYGCNASYCGAVLGTLPTR